jgi:hypothetical protein
MTTTDAHSDALIFLLINSIYIPLFEEQKLKERDTDDLGREQ